MERRLAAILIADVAGYSRLSHLDEERTRTRFLALLKDVFEPKIAEHQGRLVKTMGDGLLVEFPSVVNALRCAIAVQKIAGEKAADIPTEQRLRFRIGINLGDVIVEGEDLHGDGVNIADRLQSLADPGGIVISGSAYDHAHNKIDAGFESLGEQRVKNIDEPVRAYRVHLDRVPANPRTATRPRGRLFYSAAAVFTLLVVVAGSMWLWQMNHRPALAAPAVAVLPFDNLSGDPANARMADGLTEDIITDLSRYWDFTVIARDSTAIYKGAPTRPRPWWHVVLPGSPACSASRSSRSIGSGRFCERRAGGPHAQGRIPGLCDRQGPCFGR
jgi:class 3 adenylate cyclase